MALTLPTNLSYTKNEMTKKTVVFIDYANLRASVRELGLFLDLQILSRYLIKDYNAAALNFYYGLDPKDNKSKEFLEKVNNFGYKVVSRNVKYIRVNLAEILKKQLTQRVLDQLDANLKNKLSEIVKELERKNIPILIPKANMDAEMTMDMILVRERFENYIIFSGDSDFVPIIRYLTKQGKKVTVVSLRSHTAGEIFGSGCKYLEFRKFALGVNGLVKKQKPQRGS